MNNLQRNEMCPVCGRFANRGVSVDAVIVRDNQVLLIERGAEPFKGSWATPGGFVEWDESTEGAVSREVLEETGLTVTSTHLLAVRSNPDRHPKQVINLVYLVEVGSGEAQAGDDAQKVKWFSWEEIPAQLAFDHAQNIADAREFLDKRS